MGMNDNNSIQVSVFCLAYNHEKYIHKALDGFVNQKTNFKFEVLIHDDASTDQTASIINEYATQYPELIKPIYQTENQHSQGVKINSTFNYPRAKGKYFAWCEGDDYWCDELKLQRQFDAMEAHPECSICVHSVQCINEDGSINGRFIPDKSQGFNQTGVLLDDEVADAVFLLKGRYPFQTSSYFVRRESIQDVIDGKINFAKYMNGDEVYIRVCLREGHVYFINCIMSYYRLFSIGSYNTRYKKSALIDKYTTLLKKEEGNLLYDDYSGGKFHDKIIKSVSDVVVRCGAYNQVLLNDFLERNSWKKEDVLSQCSKRTRMKYFLSSYLHPVYLLLRRFSGSD